MLNSSYSHQNLRSRSFKGQNLRGVSFQGSHCGISYFQIFWKFWVSSLVNILTGTLIFLSIAINVFLTKEFFIKILPIEFSEVMWIASVALITLFLYSMVTLFLYQRIILAFILLVVGAVGVGAWTAATTGTAVIAATTGTAVIAAAAAAVVAAVVATATATGLIVTVGIGMATAVGTVRLDAVGILEVTGIYVIFSPILYWRSIWKEDPQLAFIRNFSLGYRSWLGTNFTESDLTEADFSHAQLGNTRFTNAKLIRTNFRQAKNLKFAYLKNTILANRAVRELLVTGDGVRQSYVGLDLTGAYLQNADLQHADLSQAILLNADLRGAKLTGAKIGNWLIDTTTLLDDIQCDYVFLGDGKREPPEGNFKAGEFTKLFQQVAKTLEFLVENRTELEALLRAAQRIRAQGVDLEFGSIENKQGSAKVTFVAPPEFERETLYAEIKREFEAQKLILAEYQGRLLEKESQIGRLEGLLTIFSQRPTHIGDIHMADERTQTITGSTIVGSTLNLGEISGRVQNNVNQMPVETSEQNDLKETLQRLRQLLVESNELSGDDKVAALEQLQKIIEAAKEPVAGQSIAKTAIRFFKGLAEEFRNAKVLVDELLGLIKNIGEFFKIGEMKQ